MSAHSDIGDIGDNDNDNGELSHSERYPHEWLLNGLADLAQARFFTFGVNHCALSAWMSQKSPCCAAAVIAQAVNCCYSSRPLWKVEDAIRALVHLVDKKISSLVDTLVSLGATCDVRALLENRLDEEAPGWNKSKKVKRSTIDKVVTKLAEEIEENSQKERFADIELFDDADTLLGDGIGQLPSPVAFDTPFEPENEPLTRALRDLAMKLDCLQRLQRPKPSTAGIGNWAIEEVLKEHTIEVKTILRRAVFGKRKPLISTTDENAWDKFKVEFNKYDCTIIHFNNHYAMVFAYREKDSLREILTAKKGQKPKDWIDWAHVISSLNRWQGYQIIGVNKMETTETQHIELKHDEACLDSNSIQS